MAEYIEREEAIQICQSYYERCLKMHDYCGDSVAYDIRANIQGLPTADVVEVVRCKNCKRFIAVPERYPYMKYCGLHSIGVSEEDFCSFSERKEGAEE